VRAALARFCLASFISDGGGTFLEYLHQRIRPWVEDRIGAGCYSILIQVLVDLESGRLSDGIEFAALQSLYSRLAGIPPQPASIPDPHEIDPIAAIFRRVSQSPRTPEVQFIARALRYMELPGRPDTHFTTLFWQLVRVRSLFHRHVVHRPLTPGLQWFVRFFDRGRSVRWNFSPPAMIESARRICGGGHGLRSLEIRTAPSSSRSELQRYVQTIAQVLKRWRRDGRDNTLDIGLVLHLIKTRGGEISSGRPTAYWRSTHADPSTNGGGNPSGYRYGRYYEGRRREAMAMEWLLRHRPVSLEFLRGLDVCTDEVGVPNWVLAPLLDRVRVAAEDGSMAMQSFYGWTPPLPRTTVHAGEDFVHLLTGMRLLDEAVEAFRLGAGDRIGHGLSLGLDPVDWAKRAGIVPVAQEDRLFDLVWEWCFYTRHGGCPDASRLSRLQAEIPRLCELIFGPLGYSARDIDNLWRDLLDPWMLYRAGFPSGPPPQNMGADPRLRLLVLYLTNPEVFHRARQLIMVETAPEAQVLAGIQRQLRAKISQIGITIEVNPTSNLLIGDLNDLTRHPLFRLRPTRESESDSPVSICVGSDDPLVFNSNLQQEYQNLFDAMKLSGFSEEETHCWIARARESGMECRFTAKAHFESILYWFSHTENHRVLPI
jgi:hypothetical protein